MKAIIPGGQRPGHRVGKGPLPVLGRVRVINHESGVFWDEYRRPKARGMEFQ